MSSPNPNQQPSLIPTQFRTISRNNSNISTASSSNKGDFSSTISTANSVASSKSQLSKHQYIDHRQYFASCGGSKPIRSFERATISSVVKTRAFDKDPMLQSILVATPSGQNSASNSQSPSPFSTPVFSRSRSLRMSGGPQRYQSSPSHRFHSRTPELYSFNSGDITSCSNESQAKLVELNNEKVELKESLEFLECERQVLIDSTKNLNDTLQQERSQWKKDQDELKRQLAESIAARERAESQLTQKDVAIYNAQFQIKKLQDDLFSKDESIKELNTNLSDSRTKYDELVLVNDYLKRLLDEKLKYNGTSFTNNCVDIQSGVQNQKVADCVSLVTELARLRLELNEKERTLESLGISKNNKHSVQTDAISGNRDLENLNTFLDQTVECIKGWPEDLASSKHVQDLMKTLLSAYKADHEELNSRLENFHL